MAWTKTDREAALWRLREHLHAGDTVYTILKHVARSGMSRVIDVYVFEIEERNGAPVVEPICLSYSVAAALDQRFDKARDGVVMGGCGMDMGFALVHELSQKLFGKSYALKQRWL